MENNGDFNNINDTFAVLDCRQSVTFVDDQHEDENEVVSESNSEQFTAADSMPSDEEESPRPDISADQTQNIVTVEDDSEIFDNINGSDIVQQNSQVVIQNEEFENLTAAKSGNDDSSDNQFSKISLENSQVVIQNEEFENLTATKSGNDDSSDNQFSKISLENSQVVIQNEEFENLTATKSGNDESSDNQYSKISLDNEAMSDASSGFENISARTDMEEPVEKTVDLDELFIKNERCLSKPSTGFSHAEYDDTCTPQDYEAQNFRSNLTSNSHESIIYSSRSSQQTLNCEFVAPVDYLTTSEIQTGVAVESDLAEEQLSTFSDVPVDIASCDSLMQPSKGTLLPYIILETLLEYSLKSTVQESTINLKLQWLQQNNFCLSLDEIQQEVISDSSEDLSSTSTTISGSVSIAEDPFDSVNATVSTRNNAYSAALSVEIQDIFEDVDFYGDFKTEKIKFQECTGLLIKLTDYDITGCHLDCECINISLGDEVESFEGFQRAFLEDLNCSMSMSFVADSESLDYSNVYIDTSPTIFVESISEFSASSFDEQLDALKPLLDNLETGSDTTEEFQFEFYSAVVEESFCDVGFNFEFEEYNKDHSGLIRPIYPFKVIKIQSYFQWLMKHNAFDALNQISPISNCFASFGRTLSPLNYKSVKVEEVEIYKDTPLSLHLIDPSKYSTPLPMVPKLENLADTDRIGPNISEDISLCTQTQTLGTTNEHFEMKSSKQIKDVGQKIATETELKDECLIEMLDVQSWTNNRKNALKAIKTGQISVPGKHPSAKQQKPEEKAPDLKKLQALEKELAATSNTRLASKGDVDKTMTSQTLEGSFSSLAPNQDFSSITLEISTDRTLQDELHDSVKPSEKIVLHPKGLSSYLKVPQNVKGPSRFNREATLERTKNKYVTRWLAKNEKDLVRLNCLKMRQEDLSTMEQSVSFETRKEPRRLSFQTSTQSYDSQKVEAKKSKTSRSLKKRSKSLPYPETQNNYADISSKVSTKRRPSDGPKRESEMIGACLDSIQTRLKSKYEQDYLGKLFDQTILENVCQFRERTLSSVQLSKVLARYDSSFNDLNIKGKQELVRIILEDPSIRIDSKTLLKRLIKQPRSGNTTKQH